jgi:hypothetical protein
MIASTRSSRIAIRAASGTVQRASVTSSASSGSSWATMSHGPSSSVAVLPASSSSRTRTPSTTINANGRAFTRLSRSGAHGPVGRSATATMARGRASASCRASRSSPSSGSMSKSDAALNSKGSAVATAMVKTLPL